MSMDANQGYLILQNDPFDLRYYQLYIQVYTTHTIFILIDCNCFKILVSTNFKYPCNFLCIPTNIRILQQIYTIFLLICIHDYYAFLHKIKL